MNEFSDDALLQAKRVAITSFIGGSVIFFAFVIFKIKLIALVGIAFLLFAILANGISFSYILYLWLWKRNRTIKIRKLILLILLNIPAAIIYSKIAGAIYRTAFGF